MPTRSLNVLITGDSKDLGAASKQAVGHIAKVEKAGTHMGKALALGFATVGTAAAAGLVVGLKKSVDAAKEAQASQSRLQAQLKASGISYSAHAKEIDNVIQKHSKLAGIDDEDLQDAFTNLVRSTGSVSKSMRDMGLVTDLARAKHINVTKAAELLGKVHAGNTGVLKRYGIALDPVTKAQDKLKESNKKATAEQVRAAKAADKAATSQGALATLQKRFGGQAEAYGKTAAGAQERFSVALENVEEKLGAGLLPVLATVTNGVAKFLQQIDSGTGLGGKFAAVISTGFAQVKAAVMAALPTAIAMFNTAKAAVVGVVGSITDLVRGFEAGKGSAVAIVSVLAGLTAGFTIYKGVVLAAAAVSKAYAVVQAALNVVMDANPIGIVVVALAGLAAGLVVAYKNSETFRNIINGVFTTVKAVAGAVITWLVGAFNTVVTEVSQWKVLFQAIAIGWKVVTTYWKAEFTLIVAVVKTAITVISTVVKTGMAVLGPIVSNVWNGIKTIIKGALDIISGFVKIFGGLLRGNFGQVWDGVKQVFRGAWEVLKGYVQTGIGSVVALVKDLPGKILHALGDLGKLLLGVGKDLIGGLVAGIRAEIGAINGVAEWLKGQVVAAVKKAFKISSPSKVMAELGGHMATGLIKGIVGGNIMGFIKNHLGGVAGLAGSALGGIGGKAAGAVKGLFGGGKAGPAPSGNVRSWIIAGLQLAGLPVTPGNIAMEYGLAMKESGGNPSIANNWDINAQRGDPSIGLMQTTGSTFRSYMVPGHGNIRNPVDNAAASFRYQIARYGHLIGFSPYAKGTQNARRGLALVGEEGPELINLKGGEQIFSNGVSKALVGIQAFANGTPSKGTPKPLTANLNKMTPLQLFEYERKLKAAQKALDKGSFGAPPKGQVPGAGATVVVADVAPAGDAGGADPNQPLIDAVNALAELEQKRIDLETQKNVALQSSLNVSQSQYTILAKAISDIANGQIGQRLGLSLSGLRSAPGSVSRI